MPRLSICSLFCLVLAAASALTPAFARAPDIDARALEKRATVTVTRGARTVTKFNVYTTFFSTVTITTDRTLHQNSTIWQTKTKARSVASSSVALRITLSTIVTVTRARSEDARRKRQQDTQGRDVTVTVANPTAAVVTTTINVAGLVEVTRTIYTATVTQKSSQTLSTTVTVTTDAKDWTQITWLITTATVIPTKPQYAEEDNGRPKMNKGAIVGGVLGTFFGIAAIIILFVLIRRKNVKNDTLLRSEKHSKDKGMYAPINSATTLGHAPAHPQGVPENQGLMENMTPALQPSATFHNTPAPLVGLPRNTYGGPGSAAPHIPPAPETPTVIPPSSATSLHTSGSFNAQDPSLFTRLSPPPAVPSAAAAVAAAESRKRAASLGKNIMPPSLDTYYAGAAGALAAKSPEISPPSSLGSRAPQDRGRVLSDASATDHAGVPGTSAPAAASFMAAGMGGGDSGSSRASAARSARFGEKLPRKEVGSATPGGSLSSRESTLLGRHEVQLQNYYHGSGSDGDGRRDITPQSDVQPYADGPADEQDPRRDISKSGHPTFIW